jgi:ribonuclease E
VAGPDESGNPVSPVAATGIQVHADGPQEGQDRQDRQPRERRGRGRDGRERRERNEQPAGESATPANAVTPESLAISEQNALQPQQERAHAATEFVAFATAPATAEIAPVQAAAPAASALPKVQSYNLPLQELAQVAEGSGLQWINSDAAKIAEAQAAIAAEAKPVRKPRERAPRVASTEAPLVLVETRRDLSGMTLPFEKSAG